MSDLPSSATRMAVAEVSGHVVRLAYGNLSGMPFPRKIESLWQISQDPAVFGHVLGPYLAEDPPTAGGAAVAELLRAAGADETVAAANAEWQRGRRERERRGGPRG
ncbi:hypothetical protein [Actinoplanes sp. NPDC048796]|uniref:hypothetical protein n=1 Tax=Actinoplanes sp. NPDC048796 TaxID=3155640 RepID=UPI0033D8A491